MYTDVKGVRRGSGRQLTAEPGALATYPGGSILLVGLNMSVRGTPPAETANKFTFAPVSRVNRGITVTVTLIRSDNWYSLQTTIELKGQGPNPN
jgi:hypothetical protein